MREVAYANTTDDLVTLLDHRSRGEHVWHHVSAQGIFLAVALGAAVVAGLAAVRAGAGTLPLRGFLLAAAVIGAMLVMPPVARWARRSSWRRMLGGDRGAALRAPRRLRIEPGGLRTVTDDGETLTPWPEVRAVTELPDHLLVEIGPTAAHVIPRRAFPSARDAGAFAAAIRAEITPPA